MCYCIASLISFVLFCFGLPLSFCGISASYVYENPWEAISVGSRLDPGTTRSHGPDLSSSFPGPTSAHRIRPLGCGVGGPPNAGQNQVTLATDHGISSLKSIIEMLPSALLVASNGGVRRRSGFG